MLPQNVSQNADYAQRDEAGKESNRSRRSCCWLRGRIRSVKPKTIGNGTIAAWGGNRRPGGLHSLFDSHGSIISLFQKNVICPGISESFLRGLRT